MAITLELDPTAEATGTVLALSPVSAIGLTQFSAPAPPPKYQWASSVDTEGSTLATRGYENRTITIGLEISNDATYLDVQEKVAKLHRDGGTLKYNNDNLLGAVVFDVLASEGFETPFDLTHYLGAIWTVQFSLTCKPYGRGAEVDLGDNVETTLPALVFTEATVTGDVPALGRLVIDDDSANDQYWLTWGVQSRYYSSATSAALFYEAEGRTLLGAATTAVGPTGASGGGSNVVQQATLIGSWLAMLSTQATGGGAHLSHVGTFRVWARVQMPTANAGEVSIALEWAEGDFRRRNTNPAVTFEANHSREGAWILVDLGLVTLRAVTQGTQRWEGRILAKSTVTGDDLYVDCFALIPADEGSGVVRGIPQYEASTALSAHDEFDQTAGALTGKTIPAGGTWAGAGDADDFQVETTGKTAQRTAVSDAGGTALVNGRVALAGVATYTNIYVQVSGTYTNAGTAAPVWGVFARYTDSSNWLTAQLFLGSSSSSLLIAQRVAGVDTTLHTLTSSQLALHPPGATRTMRMLVDDQGRVFVWLWDVDGTPGQPVAVGYSAALATGGALATGRIGFVDYYLSATACTRNYDNFAAAVPTKDAAVFASQSLEIRHDRVTREDSAGAIWTEVSDAPGDYLKIPPSGSEARTLRVIVKGSRNDPEWGADSGIDDISARLFVTPRYLVVPT
jgi:hypothetical protein